MKFSLFSMLASLTSAQELLIPVADEIDWASPGCGFTFKECDPKTIIDTSKFWKMDVAATTCDVNPIK